MMTKRVLLALLLLPSPLVGQEQGVGPPPGRRVRVTLHEAGRRYVGQYQGLREDGALVLKRFEGVMDLPPSVIKHFDVINGRKRHTRTGVVAGAIVGSVLGLGLAARSDCNEEAYPDTVADSCGAIVLGVGAVGGVLGLVVGALTVTDDWKRVDLPTLRPSVSVQPNTGRVRISGTIRF